MQVDIILVDKIGLFFACVITFHAFIVTFCISIKNDIFHIYLSIYIPYFYLYSIFLQPLITFQYQSIALFYYYYFFNLLAMLIHVQKENELDQFHIFRCIYLKRFQVHQLAIMYCLKPANRDTYKTFLFQSFSKLFFRACNLHQ